MKCAELLTCVAVLVLPAQVDAIEPARAGESTPACGDAAFHWLTAAAGLVQQGSCRALVTAPISKASWHAAGHVYPALAIHRILDVLRPLLLVGLHLGQGGTA